MIMKLRQLYFMKIKPWQHNQSHERSFILNISISCLDKRAHYTISWFTFENFHIISLIVYNFLNIFNLWSIYLLIVGFAKVYDVSYKKASVLYLQFLIKMIPLLIIYLIVS